MEFVYKVINISPVVRKIVIWTNYKLIRTRNAIKKFLLGKSNNKFLFILSGPYYGSTLLNELISTSVNVSVNNNVATREGQTLPELVEEMFDTKDRWNPNKNFDWEYVKSIWMKYWDLTKPVLLEKSPPNILRAIEIDKTFKPAYYICLTRDPYAHIEGLMRRENRTVQYAANFTMMCLKYQKRNLEGLENIILIRYEELVNDTEGSINKIIQLIPEIGAIKVKKQFRSHNYKKESMSITDLNKEKIAKISKTDLVEINKILSTDIELLKFFNYSIIE